MFTVPQEIFQKSSSNTDTIFMRLLNRTIIQLVAYPYPQKSYPVKNNLMQHKDSMVHISYILNMSKSI